MFRLSDRVRVYPEEEERGAGGGLVGGLEAVIMGVSPRRLRWRYVARSRGVNPFYGKTRDSDFFEVNIVIQYFVF